MAARGRRDYARLPSLMGLLRGDIPGRVPVQIRHSTLYGQGDAGLIWFRTIRKQLTKEQSFNQSDADPSYFWKRT